MPLSLANILENKAVVVFSYGEDTITIQYRPYINDRRFYRRLVQLAQRTALKKPDNIFKQAWWYLWRVSERRLCYWYLRRVIQSWDVTQEGKPLSVVKGLRALPFLFVRRLYFALNAELNEAMRGSIDEELKKK